MSFMIAPRLRTEATRHFVVSTSWLKSVRWSTDSGRSCRLVPLLRRGGHRNGSRAAAWPRCEAQQEKGQRMYGSATNQVYLHPPPLHAALLSTHSVAVEYVGKVTSDSLHMPVHPDQRETSRPQTSSQTKPIVQGVREGEYATWSKRLKACKWRRDFESI